MILVPAFLSAEKIRDSIVEICEAHVGSFHLYGVAVMLVQALLRARKHRQSIFIHRVGPVKLLQSRLCGRKHQQRNFLLCGSHVKLVQD